MVSEQLDRIRERMAAACERCGRRVDAVSLLAVTKTVSPDRIQEAVDCGLTVFGESRVQEARQKIPLCAGHLEWHFIGHLQSNKVRDAAALFRMIHAVDSLRLLQMLDRACEAQGTRPRVCLEVNVSGEGSKFGLPPEGLEEAVQGSRGLLGVDVVGLMTIPPASREAEDARPAFRRLKGLRDDVASRTGVDLPVLSMGMSGDFEVAIEEGATWIRLGSVLFGKRSAGTDE